VTRLTAAQSTLLPSRGLQAKRNPTTCGRMGDGAARHTRAVIVRMNPITRRSARYHQTQVSDRIFEALVFTTRHLTFSSAVSTRSGADWPGPVAVELYLARAEASTLG
jgi:hypothetical protein